ncbi:hypothetical protein GCM10008994_24380 [Halorubrum ejinorense]|uniref:Uncharacterized protein n=1 Tax=Halorubrum ejinorense TaxID=425309 RepID=A0AAV3SUN1_9EURY
MSPWEAIAWHTATGNGRDKYGCARGRARRIGYNEDVYSSIPTAAIETRSIHTIMITPIWRCVRF